MRGDETFLFKKKKEGRERERESSMETHSRINEKVILKERSRPPFFFDEGHSARKSIYFHSIIIIVINTSYYSLCMKHLDLVLTISMNGLSQVHAAVYRRRKFPRYCCQV